MHGPLLLALKVKREEGKLEGFVFKKTPNKKKERKQKKSKKEIPKDFHRKRKEKKNRTREQGKGSSTHLERAKINKALT